MLSKTPYLRVMSHPWVSHLTKAEMTYRPSTGARKRPEVVLKNPPVVIVSDGYKYTFYLLEYNLNIFTFLG